MKKIKIFLLLFVLFISVSAVSAEGNFTALQEEVDLSTGSMEITQNYVYDNVTDYELNDGILINKSNFTINGNGYTINASNQARIFNIIGDNITINNLNFINSNSRENDGGAIFFEGTLTLNNATFTNNIAKNGGAIFSRDKLILNNVTFTNNSAERGGSLHIDQGIISNATFTDSKATYATAIWSDSHLIINDSLFKNLVAEETAGAIAIKGSVIMEINNCTFQNIAAMKNGGVLYIDNVDENSNSTFIRNSRFFNSSADFGGAIVQLDGIINIVGCEFVNNYALYSGGAIFVSYVNLTIVNTLISGNQILTDDKLYGGGGICSDYSDTRVENCVIVNNTKSGIYSYDKSLNVKNTTFSNNGEAIHGVFIDYELNDVDVGNDALFLNDTFYSSIIYANSTEIMLINNIIDVATLPSRYDSRDWGWVSPVKDQGDMGACWTFGSCGALESSLLKATGVEYDLSENNMQNSMLKYSKYGMLRNFEGADEGSSLSYIISWLGVMPSMYDTFDKLGKLSPLLLRENNIHIQDVIILPHSENGTDIDVLKKTILKCGSIIVSYCHDDGCFNKTNSAYYSNTNGGGGSHVVSIVGWDDNYPKENFKLPRISVNSPESDVYVMPPGDGAWIVKNSFGTGFGDNGYMYMSYYDQSLLRINDGEAYLIENIENYTAIYQTDLSGDREKIESNGSIISYENSYQSYRTELISAVGSYFDEGENYTLEIYVNDVLVHVQNGTAPFCGYHTVKLTSEIPINKGDIFKAVMNKASVMQLFNSRQHYLEGITFVNYGDGWKDLALENKTISLKVYTKDLPVYTQDLVKIYKNDSKFEAYIGVANEAVVFEINGMEYIRVSDENGTARIAINLNPGDYTIKTCYNNFTVENRIIVLSTLYADNLVKYFRNASQFYIDLIDGEGNILAGKNITMNINGVFYERVTNENGTARLNINLNPGVYILTAIDPLTGLQMSYNITVLSTLNATDLEMTYKDGSTFNITVLDGQGKPLNDVAVSFNVNGVFYNRTTDSSGIAKLNINLMSGKYIITSEYEGLQISNTITIKD